MADWKIIYKWWVWRGKIIELYGGFSIATFDYWRVQLKYIIV